MEDEQVDLVDAQLAGALVEGVEGLVVAVVTDPDLGFDEDVLAIDATAADGIADTALVAVRSGGVDVAVADAQRGLISTPLLRVNVVVIGSPADRQHGEAVRP